MKYLVQIGIIGAICTVAELLYVLLPFPIPASVYGLVLLFLLLMTGIVKLQQIEETADFLLLIMPVLFLEPSVKLMTALPILKGQAVRLFLLCIVSTCVTIMVTGVTAQALIRRKRRRREQDDGQKERRGEGGNE